MVSILNKRVRVAPWEQNENVIELIAFRSPEAGPRALQVALAQVALAHAVRLSR